MTALSYWSVLVITSAAAVTMAGVILATVLSKKRPPRSLVVATATAVVLYLATWTIILGWTPLG